MTTNYIISALMVSYFQIGILEVFSIGDKKAYLQLKHEASKSVRIKSLEHFWKDLRKSLGICCYKSDN
ncbi:hypothetical protein BpHYR1_002105 [Brachionus plicatilis]|uniref:Uncharacterized protein n=1 Tax=Brachionus plicatilis TaxID=10195 RepID=A0A3M7T9D2_BRAPC|nr:hypothetical protein BpHYR1_002105 [Brachionus plicatilis]